MKKIGSNFSARVDKLHRVQRWKARARANGRQTMNTARAIEADFNYRDGA